MGFVSYEVGWVQKGLIFSKHRILDRFLHHSLAVTVVYGGGGVLVDIRKYKEEMDICEWRL